MKHVGKVGEKPCVILVREILGNPAQNIAPELDNCLVVETSNLAESDHDALMNVVQSAEGQQAHDIMEVLNRRQFNDGSNMLTSLHQNRKINKVSVDMVVMTPTPSDILPLREVNLEIRKKVNGSNPPLSREVDPATLNESVVNPATPADTVDPGTTEDVAAGLLTQAEILEEDAAAFLADSKAKRAEAYALNPELKPKRGPGRPPKED